MVGTPSATNPYRARGLAPLKGETHLHTVHSDGKDTPAVMLEACRQAGYDFAAITDHNTISGHGEARAAAADLGLVLLPGAELTTFHGHAVCLGIERMPEWRDLETRGMDAFAADVHAQGGLLQVSHPTRLGSPACTGCAWEWPVSPSSLDLWEIFSGANPVHPHSALSALFWRRLLDGGGHATPVAAGDVHSRAAAAAARPATYVYASESSASAVLDGLRAGRLFSSAGQRLDLWLEGPSQQPVLVGERAPAAHSWRARIDVEPGDGYTTRLVFNRRGQIQLLPSGAMVAGPGWVYAEVVDGSEGSPRAVTAPIWMV